MRRAPRAGTISARVWALAEEMAAAKGCSQAGLKTSQRARVVAAAQREGINPATANTQFGHWSRAMRAQDLPDPAPTKAMAPGGETGEDEPPWTLLLKSGFSYVADWRWGAEGLWRDRAVPKAPGVYGFLAGDQLVYLGLTRRTLHQRMEDYRRGHRQQKTSARIHSALITATRDGGRVGILTAEPGHTRWNGLEVEIAPGLEAGLIARFRPAWNIMGR